MIIVYYENTNSNGVGTYAEAVAVVPDTELYKKLLPVFEADAKANGFDMVTESAIHDDDHVKEVMKLIGAPDNQ